MNSSRLRAASTFWLIALFCIFGVAFALGLRGIDFGAMWDERKLTNEVEISFQSGKMLPSWFNYPSVAYDLTLATGVVLSAAVYEPTRSRVPAAAFQRHLSTTTLDYGSIRYIRSVFLFATLLTIFWVYLAVRVWTDDAGAGLFAAALIASSWEVSYHARWIAPDGLAMMFGALAIAGSAAALRGSGARLTWLCVAATAAGLACSSKYPSGLFLAPVLIASGVARRESIVRWRGKLGRLLVLSGIFVLAFLVATPGAIITPFQFIHDIYYEILHYQILGHGGHTIEGGLQHAGLAFVYLVLVAFSKWWPLALGLFGFVLIGTITTIRRDSWASLVFITVPVLYFAYMTRQNVMVARNYLPLLAPLAILAAFGFAALRQTKWFAEPRRRMALLSVLALVLIADFAGLVSAAGTIGKGHDHAPRLVAYLEARPDERFVLSAGARMLLDGAGLAVPANVIDKIAAGDEYVFLSREKRAVKSNRLGLYRVISGPEEVNFDYYASWGKHAFRHGPQPDFKVIAIRIERARSLEILPLGP